MRILVSGASGLVGSALIPYLKMRGHEILRLTRHAHQKDDIKWDPETGQLDLAGAGKLDAVIHLAGENIAEGRWNSRKKEKILFSRKRGTRLLCDALAAMSNPPQVLISASGINYYAKQPGAAIDENAPAGTGFLSEVCREWELGTLPAEQAGIRVCRLRIGMVLTPAGGALKKMLLPFRLALGGRIGSGEQRTGWITIDDLVGMIDRALSDKRWQGAVNAVAKEPVSNRDFTMQLAKTLRRPAILPMPAFMIRLLFGEMVNETLLADLPVYSTRLRELDYQLRHPELAGALCHLLGKADE
ncbi:MAG: TIGR01777 family oxidoreductase [Verrucomicrobiales bacterium]